MRVVAALVMLASACRFAPTGGLGAPDDGAVTDAGDDGGAIDARPIDATASDATPVDAPTSCPAWYSVLFLGHHFGLSEGETQFAQAADGCNQIPGKTHLATFELAVVMDTIVTAVDPDNSATPYVGATCSTTQGDCNQKLSWRWVTDSFIDLGAWAENQPDNDATKTAGMVVRQNGRWQLANTSPTSTLSFICECDP